jgi:undecaprenyl-diphosphatase
MVGPFHFDAFALKATFASFPSGHTITAFATCLALGYFIPRLRWPLLLLACLVGVSRVVISAHYASDVVAGAAIGFGTTYLLRRAFARRGLVFKRSPRGLVPRGEGMVLPALTALISTRASHRA